MIRLDALHARWHALAAGERRLIALGAALLLPVLVYLYLWQPMVEDRARLERAVARMRGELAELQAGAEELRRLRALGGARAPEGLDAAARLIAGRFQIETRMKSATPQGPDRLSVSFDAVPFDAWVRWVGELAMQGIVLRSCSVDPAGAGLVRVEATLARGRS